MSGWIKSCLKWPGGKSRHLDLIFSKIDRLFDGDRVFWDVCGGSAVVGLNAASRYSTKTVISDVNPSLINFFIELRDFPDRLITSIFAIERAYNQSINPEQYYYDLREKYNKEPDPAKFFALNRLCYNGVVRYNQKGEFNCPWGKRQFCFNASTLLRFSEASHLIDFQVYDLRLGRPENAFLFIDPPYLDGFTGYTPAQLVPNDEETLQLLLDGPGIMTNSIRVSALATKKGLCVEPFTAKRAVNPGADRHAQEILIWREL